jgi:hypothetical protein
MTQHPKRPGYAMTLVLIFVLLFVAILGVGWRRLGSAVRVQSVRVGQVQRDQGSIQALGLGLGLLETGLPPTNPYVCSVSVTTSQGVSSCTVTFTQGSGNVWAVQSLPTVAGTNYQAMPATFASK